jgi:hypothetical protein
MKLQRSIILSFIFCLFSATAQADHFPVGTDVLADCHSFFARGKIKRLYQEQYVVNFYKDSRPVFCTPFAWSSMFLVPYKPVDQFTGKLKTNLSILGGSKEQVFKTGDKLKIGFKANLRGEFFSHKYTVIVAIKEINVNGSAQLEIIDGETKAKQVFQRWVGTNYVLLDFTKSLTSDRLTIQEVEML